MLFIDPVSGVAYDANFFSDTQPVFHIPDEEHESWDLLRPS